MPTLFVAPTANFVQTTLNGNINDSQSTITLNSTSNLQAPGYIVIDRVDSGNTATPNAREIVFYTGVSGNDLTGCTRGADNSTARSHSSGAIVETTPSVGMWNSLATIIDRAITNDGYLKAIASPVSIARMHIQTHLEVSGASVTGNFPLNPVFAFVGSLSGPTTTPQVPLSMPQAGSFRWFSVMTRTVASGASAIIDINVNGVSVFDAGTRPAIAGGGTFVSTASIATKAFAMGARLSWDYDTTGGHITDFTIQGRT